MGLLALSLALAAAAIHAGWNVLLAHTRDAEAALAVVLMVAVVLYAPLAILRWQVSWEVLPYLAASATLELAYFALLGAAYRRYELGVVYPLARGLAPVLVLVVGIAVGGAVSTLQTAGVVLVALGIVLVRGLKRVGHVRDVWIALAIAACIAGYTLADQQGVRYADPVPYIELVTLGPAVVYGIIMIRLKGAGVLQACLTWRIVAAAAAMVGAYTLVLIALRIAPAAPVAAVRETSVVIAVLLAATVLHEPVKPMQFAGAGLVAVGIALLA